MLKIDIKMFTISGGKQIQTQEKTTWPKSTAKPKKKQECFSNIDDNNREWTKSSFIISWRQAVPFFS